MGISEFQEIENIYSKNGVSQIFVKELSAKQDNDKNQIYLGKDPSNFPGIFKERGPSNSKSKRKSEYGKNKVEILLNFFWLDHNGVKYHAPNTRIINYFQYPEIRLSGFLKGCSSSSVPDSLRRVNQQKYGKRFLCLGVNENNEVLGFVVNEHEDPLCSNFPVLAESSVSSIIKTHTIGYLGRDPKDLLINELKAIKRKGWHKSVRLPKGYDHPIPFKGNQGGGYTLEALLGIVSNSKKTPDKYGFEIKAHQQQKVTLMTPVADLGYEGKSSFKNFMDRYGKKGKKDPTRLVFNGLHRIGKNQRSTNCTLRLSGYDPINKVLNQDSDKINIELFNNESGEIASGWSFKHFLESWCNKHQLACYVPYEKRRCSDKRHDYEYNYGENILICEGTSVIRLIRSIYDGNVFYDPGHTLYYDGRGKKRPQWRVPLTYNYRYIQNLYNNIEEIPID